MRIIQNAAELAAITDPTLCPILERFADLMELATIFICQRGDTLATIEQARGMPFDYWEMIDHHYPYWFEAIFVLSDDGAGHIVLVPDRPCIDPDLLALCRENATKPGDMIDF
jgi:hypothetical protein